MLIFACYLNFKNCMQNDNISNDNTNANSSKLQDTSSNTPLSDMQKKVKIETISEGVFKATTDESKYIIEYDINKCIGAASCAAIAPLTFFMNEENKAELRSDVDNFDEDDVIMAAAQSCPVFAIKIIEKSSGTVLFPVDEVD
jgi:ferredoxin